METLIIWILALIGFGLFVYFVPYRNIKIIQNKLDKIGNFGSGFKTVHQFCNEPEIFTSIDGELIGFKIEEKIIPSPLKISKKMMFGMLKIFIT